MANPKCKLCGKTLIAEYDPLEWKDKFYNGLEPLKTKIKYAGTILETTYGFWGNYGYSGNNHFCSMRCGYRYAVRICNN